MRVKNTGDVADRHFRLVTIDLGQVDDYGDPITSTVALPAHKVKVTGDGLRPSERAILAQIALVQDADSPPKSSLLLNAFRDKFSDRTIYGAISRMRKNGLITKDASGAFSITEKGRAMLDESGDSQ